MTMIRTGWILGVALGGWVLQAAAADLTSRELEFFENEVRPLLVKHCYECHSLEADKVKGGLLLDSREGWQAGGDSGDVIEPGHPERSLLIESVRHQDPDLEMPPKYRMEDREIAVLEQWITRGAKGSAQWFRRVG